MSPFSSTNVSAKSSIPSNRQTFFIDSPKGNQSKRNDEGKQYKFFSPIPMRKRYAFSADKAGSIASNDVATSSVAGDTECELTESMEAPSKQSKQKKEKKDFNDFDIWRPSRASLKRAAMQDNSGYECFLSNFHSFRCRCSHKLFSVSFNECILFYFFSISEPFKSKASSMPFPSNTLEEHSGGTASTILSCDFTAKIMEARRRMQAMAASDMGRKIFQSDEKQPEQRTSKGKSKQSGMSQNYKRVATNDSASKVKKNIDDEKTVRVVKEPHCGYELDAYATAKEVSIRNNMRWSSSRFQRNAPGCVSNMERANAIRTELISMGINDLAKSNAAKDEPRSKVTSGSNISMTLSQAKLARNELIKMGYSEHDCLSKSFKQFIWTSGPSTKRKLYVPARKYYLSGSGDRAEENCDGRLYEQPPKPRELERVKNAGAFVEDKVPKKLPYMLSDTYNEYIKFQEPTMPPVLRAESVSNRSSSNDWERSKNM